jgi:hypothetical protein
VQFDRKQWVGVGEMVSLEDLRIRRNDTASQPSLAELIRGRDE